MIIYLNHIATKQKSMESQNYVKDANPKYNLPSPPR